MKIPSSSAGIKSKIVAGFSILLILAFIAVLAIIKLATQLTPPDSGISSSVTKLTLTSNLLSSLIEADGQARAYINTGDSHYLTKYLEQEKVTRQLIDSLTNNSISNTNQYLRMIAVDSLLDLKNNSFNNFFALKNGYNESSSLDIRKIVQNYDDSFNISNRTISKTITQQLPVPQSKKKGFFPKLWNNLIGKKSDTMVAFNPGTQVKYDTLMTYKAVRDTTLSLVKSQLREIEAEEKFAKQLTIERELNLIRADQDIMNEIRAVLLLFEKEEIFRAIDGTEKSRVVLSRLWITALILAALGLITTTGFIIMIWKDLAKSAFYRKQLEHAHALSESLLKVKEQFLANMSHEIRTPLTSIIGFTERLSNTQINNEQLRYVNYINSSSEHLLELINELLDFSRIDNGKFSLDSKPFDPTELFQQAYDTLQPRAKEKGVEMILKQGLPPINILGDPLRLRQIILNLLSNSIKFTEKGKVMLQTKGSLSDDNNYLFLVIRVADTGIGIPLDKQEYIFEEFTQVDHSITRKYGGSGLGLTISRKLVELMNGTIDVISRPGQGTIFTIKLKLLVFHGDVVKPTSGKTISTNLDNLRILLAEDDITTRILLSEFMESNNAKVYQAIDGKEAMESFIKNSSLFNLIITDIQMPGMSGIELVHNIKEYCMQNKLNVPIVIGLTAHADSKEIESYKSDGMDYFIIKPFKDRDLNMVLNKVAENIRFSFNSTNENSIEIANFKKFANDDEESLIKILMSLADNLEKTKSELQIAFNSSNYNEIALLSHRVLPNVKLLGARVTAEHLRNLEIICRQVPIDTQSITSIFQQSILYLTEISEQLKSNHLSAKN